MGMVCFIHCYLFIHGIGFRQRKITLKLIYISFMLGIKILQKCRCEKEKLFKL